PPVIVYTGRDLSGEEEQRLRRYSKSIIIKGAKSPERLLDEVSLFLHQVISDLPDEQQRMIRQARNREALLEGRRILVVEDDVRNVYSLTSILEPRGARVQIARNGREAIQAIEESFGKEGNAIDLVLMDVMMPIMDGEQLSERHGGQDGGDRDSVAAGGAVPEVSLRLPRLRHGFAEAAAEARPRAPRFRNHFRHAGPAAARRGDIAQAHRILHPAGQRDVSRPGLFSSHSREGGS